MNSHSLRRTSTAAWALLLLFSSVQLAADNRTAPQAAPVAATEPQRFTIETITIEGADTISPDILLSELLLKQGGSYTEPEIRAAHRRIVRLPFVLAAEFSLRKGSGWGLYELVIVVEETRRWFFGVDLEVTRWSQPISFEDLGSENFSDASAGLSGRRFSAGRHSLFFVAAGGEDGSLNLGFNQYNLFDRSILLSVSVLLGNCTTAERSDNQKSGSCRTDLYELGLDPTFSTWSSDGGSTGFRLDLGVPLNANQSVRLASSFRSAETGFRRQAFSPGSFGFYDFENLEEQRTQLSWVYNSVDEPVLPTEGLSLEAGVTFNSLRADLQSVTLEGERPDIQTSMDSRELGLQLTGIRYWPVKNEQTLSAKLRLFVGRSDIEGVPTEERALLSGQLDVLRGSLSAGHTKFLKRTRPGSRRRDLSWETDVEFRYGSTSPDFAQAENPIAGYRIGSGMAFRNTWGLFRLKFSYLDLDGR